MINEMQKNFLIELLKKDQKIPDDFKYLLFPPENKEYEIVYSGKMRKEDLLANEDGVLPVPIQLEKEFFPFKNKTNNKNNNWKNMIVFGDNLQLLKYFIQNKNTMIKVKGKVKLVYIDPPFGTGDQYDGNKGQNAYSAKKKGSDFVEFLRRRLILAKETLSEDGFLVIRLDYHFGHYVKIVLDEVFGKNHFVNEIIINRIKKNVIRSKKQKSLPTSTDSLYIYGKTVGTNLLKTFVKMNKPRKAFWRHMDDSAGQGTSKIFFGKKLNPPLGKHFKYSQKNIDIMIKERRLRFKCINCAYEHYEGNWINCYSCGKDMPKPEYLVKEKNELSLDTNWTDIPGYSISTGYPTENSEQLLERVLLMTTNPGDIVFDFFGGSGTTISVAEKLGRRWITCDIGKLSYFTMQKRMLQIQDSKDLINPNKKYGKQAHPFITCTLGLYDLKKTLQLEWDKYLEFVSGLFDVELGKHKISGLEFDGKKDNYFVKIWDYNKYKNSNVDENYLNNIHRVVGDKINNRLYIIAPANHIDFITDYYEVENVRYYFLKIPYQLINELHKIPFQKLRQPQSKNNINDLDEAIGFHFIKVPEVKTELLVSNDNVILKLKKFKSQYYKDEQGKILENFETLSAIFIDKNYDGNQFVMTDFYFADELISKKYQKGKSTRKLTENEVKKELINSSNLGIDIKFKTEEVGKEIMIVYTDIYGNDFTEILTVNVKE